MKAVYPALQETTTKNHQKITIKDRKKFCKAGENNICLHQKYINMEPISPQPETNAPAAPPKNWLLESILVTLFCCLPFGIVGIIFASQVSSKFAAGDHAGALKASQDAGKWTKIGFFVGIGVIVLYILFFVVLGVFSIPSLSN